MSKENKNSKKLNGALISESLLDYNNLANQLKENATDAVKELLAEQVRQAYASLLNESDEDDEEVEDYEVEEVDDAEATDTDETDENDAAEAENAEEDAEEGMEPEENAEEEEETVEDETVVDEEPADGDESGDEEDGIGSDFDKYKVSDNQYDFRNAKDDEIVKVYKRLKDDDGVTVVKNDDKVQISDSETGAEYIIDMSSDSATSDEITDEITTDDMNESTIYEIALNEYDSKVGYTDNYQDKDVMTSDGVEQTGKGRDIDAGVPKTPAKPWSKKKDGAPYNDKEAKPVEECGGLKKEEPEIEESGVVHPDRRHIVKSHVPNASGQNHPENTHVVSVAGEYKGTNEAIVKKANKIFNENKKLKEKLNNLTEFLKEAAVNQVNLGGIIKLISENSTTQEEKRNIISRFTNEAHTIEESKSLYKTISDELHRKPQANTSINEEKQFGTTNSEVISESKFYQDESLMDSLGLMHRICK